MENLVLNYLKANLGKNFRPEFAPPFTKWLNGTLLKIEEGEAEMSFVVREEMTNALGILHGGIHSAILDEVIGMTISVMSLPTVYVSLNLNVDFLAPAKTGETITAKVKVVRAGKTIIHAIGELYNAQNQLLSKATTNLANTGKPRQNLQIVA